MMKCYIRNYFKFFEYYDLEDKNFYVVNEDMKTNGFYSLLKNNMIMIYVYNGDIIVSFNEKQITIDDNTICKYNNRKLVISNNDSIIEVYCYADNDVINNPFYNEVEEDYDLCKLIYNILNDTERKKIFIENNSNIY